MASTTQTIPPATGIKNALIVVQSNSIAGISSLTGVGAPGTNTLNVRTVRNFFRRNVVGAFNSNVRVMVNGAYATGTATLASVVATDTIVIGGVTLTADNSLQDTTHFKVGGSNTATAANLVTTIGANTSLTRLVQATSALGVVTIACLVPGTIGNLVTLSQTGGHITVGSTLTGGTDGTAAVTSHGL